MILTEDTIYRHEELGEVLVLSVHHVFDTYDLDSQEAVSDRESFATLRSGTTTVRCHRVSGPRRSRSFGRSSAVPFELVMELNGQRKTIRDMSPTNH